MSSSRSSSSESEPEQESLLSKAVSRLGACEVCDASEAIYTCPKCEVKTCRLECSNIHKSELECDGIRDRTKFIRIQDFTTSDLLSDYHLLEECARFVYSKKRDEKKRFTRIDKDLPIHLYKLKAAARTRGTALQFLTQNFSRHAKNTTFYDWKTNVISWRVEWIFPNATPSALKYIDERCPETVRVSQLLDKYLSGPVEAQRALDYYRAAGLGALKVLLKAERVPGSAHKYFELDLGETLGDNLAGKCIVEYPQLCVVHRDHAANFDIVLSDDEWEEIKEEQKGAINEVKPEQMTQEASKLTQEASNLTPEHNGHISQSNNLQDQNGHPKHYENYRGRGGRGQGRGRGRGRGQDHRKRTQNRELVTQKFAKEKKLELQKELKAERKKKPKNLLFTTGYSSDESLSYSDDEKPTKT